MACVAGSNVFKSQPCFGEIVEIGLHYQELLIVCASREISPAVGFSVKGFRIFKVKRVLPFW